MKELINILPFIRKPCIALIDVTKRCNLKCSYCFGLYADTRGDLNGKQFIEIMRSLRTLGVRRIGLSGGEALLHPDIDSILKEAYALGFSVGLNSNGILVPQLIDVLKPLDNLTISIDSSTAEIHDTYRGEGSFDKAIAGLQAAYDAGIPLHLAMTVSEHNRHEIEHVLILAKRFKAQLLISPRYEEISSKNNEKTTPVENRFLIPTLQKIIELKGRNEETIFNRGRFFVVF